MTSSIKFHQNIFNKKKSEVILHLRIWFLWDMIPHRYRKFRANAGDRSPPVSPHTLTDDRVLHVAMREGHTRAPADESNPIRHTSGRVLQIKYKISTRISDRFLSKTRTAAYFSVSRNEDTRPRYDHSI